jgi:hypothetical protein
MGKKNNFQKTPRMNWKIPPKRVWAPNVGVLRVRYPSSFPKIKMGGKVFMQDEAPAHCPQES